MAGIRIEGGVAKNLGHDAEGIVTLILEVEPGRMIPLRIPAMAAIRLGQQMTSTGIQVEADATVFRMAFAADPEDHAVARMTKASGVLAALNEHRERERAAAESRIIAPTQSTVAAINRMH